MKFVQQLLAFAFLLHQILAQDPPGFISLDCGLRGSNGYNDSKTGLFYTTDDAYIETGQSMQISPEYTRYLARQFTNVRSFPGSQGSRNCYTFRPLHGQGNKILLRVAFVYGNYDGENKPPEFDVYLGVDYWMTVKIIFSSFDEEIRPFDPLRPMYNTTSGSLELVKRLNVGYLDESYREMNVYVDGVLWKGPFATSYLTVQTVYNSFIGLNIKRIFINATSKSKLPPMLNALEIYLEKTFLHSETDLHQADAIYSVKKFYGIKRNWEGDPCLPQSFVWIGINCTYTAFGPPNIISLDLSSSKMVGVIAPSFTNLTMLRSLDLSDNNLTGEVPDFLSWLPSLSQLYLQGNNFTGAMPPALLEKSKNGSLALRFDDPVNKTTPVPDNCVNDACKKNKRNTTIVPIVTSLAGFFTILFVTSIIFYIFIRRKRGSFIEPQLRKLSFSEVMNMIKDRRLLGEGGFGNVYQGWMNGVQVAVKVLKVSPEEQTTDFKSEVKILATVHHTNLTRILGYCNEGINRAIIFELMENGNLMSHLSGANSNALSWETRLFILHGAAQGLEYLHHGCDPPIIHRDIKPENILLTRDFVAKLADFGLSRIFPVQTARIVGTIGYHDPEYNEPSMLTEKVDVYSFGVVMLVVLTGQPAILQGTTHITQWIAPQISTGDIRSIFDPRLQQNYDINAAWRVLELGMACVSKDASTRPNMHNVVRELNECLPTSAAETPQHADNASLIITPNMGSLFSPGTR